MRAGSAAAAAGPAAPMQQPCGHPGSHLSLCAASTRHISSMFLSVSCFSWSARLSTSSGRTASPGGSGAASLASWEARATRHSVLNN